ncbi:type II toxin-antitoxin system VapC family toxin [Phototrophicus methaneseepsis]|uniref:Type II toxin-antitoxin system VapC family toxin n=1 Tax=Phototrophicus methaneseepsis TaxID=2710758 RepID=A0A7S8E9G2_9CHLR|nr:type II toxin-antitoxin system VapC family toxin [Phototrophicus methaneseepsis]QPC82805.1 type II toxin-antitoxin system VapC family toxin [Phototrophicus methaneseepsis]
MSYIIDTHTFLWFINDHVSLSSAAKEIIQQSDNAIYLSIASVWEMAIKVSLNKLEMPSPFSDFIENQLIENSIGLLHIKTDHTGIVATLPFYHRDPFDRIIIAQAIHEGYSIVSKDAVFDQYDINRQW